MKKCPDTFSRVSIVTQVLPSRDFEVRRAIVRIANINTTLKGSINKFIAFENIYHGTNQADLSFPCYPVNHKYSWKKTQVEKKANSTLQHLRTEFRSRMGEKSLNALSLVYNHRGILLDYDKIIKIYASKYTRKMLLINPLSEN